MSKLTDAAIQIALTDLPGWQREGDAIRRTITLPSFSSALVFAGAVGHLANRADHHPDILIQYKNVTLTLTSHDAGGLTERDFALAKAIDGLVD